MAKAKHDELYARLDTREGEKDLYRLARQRIIKHRDGRTLTREEIVQRRWKELMNEENDRVRAGRSKD